MACKHARSTACGTRRSWCGRQDSNLQSLVSKTSAFALFTPLPHESNWWTRQDLNLRTSTFAELRSYSAELLVQYVRGA